MIVTKCPLRLSLVGGSTDLEEFIRYNGRGSVISFPCNLYVYITLHANNRDKFIINYTKNEEVSDILDIQNDIAREVMLYFSQSHNLPKLTISFKSDVFSEGSGLAASSAYVIALIKALCLYTGKTMSAIETCELALHLERRFNGLTGYQDSYGCGMPNLKRMVFVSGARFPEFQYFDSRIFDRFNLFLVYTGVTRSSTKILKSLDLEKCKNLLEGVNKMTEALNANSDREFIQEINNSWEYKKQTSDQIMNGNLLKIEQSISDILDKSREGFKLCGAGGGGYFLVFTAATNISGGKTLKERMGAIPIKLDDTGVYGVVI